MATRYENVTSPISFATHPTYSVSGEISVTPSAKVRTFAVAGHQRMETLVGEPVVIPNPNDGGTVFVAAGIRDTSQSFPTDAVLDAKKGIWPLRRVTVDHVTPDGTRTGSTGSDVFFGFGAGHRASRAARQMVPSRQGYQSPTFK